MPMSPTLLITFVDDSNNNFWDDLATRALFTYWSTVHEPTDFTPALMMFGRELQILVRHSQALAMSVIGKKNEGPGYRLLTTAELTIRVKA